MRERERERERERDCTTTEKSHKNDRAPLGQLGHRVISTIPFFLGIVAVPAGINLYNGTRAVGITQ